MSERLCLVTGGAGFIGRHVTRALLARGHRVRVFDLDAMTLKKSPGIERVKGSITDRQAVAKALNKVDWVFHLAANPNLWAPDKAVFHQVNYQGSQTVLEEAVRAGVERIVYTSTEAVLKSCHNRSPEPISEAAHMPDLEDMAGPYARSKWLAEHTARKMVLDGAPIVIVYPTIPIGAGDGSLTPPTRMILGYLTGAMPGYVDAMMNFADVADIGEGHVLAAEKGVIGQTYILGGENLRLSELLKILQEETGVTMPGFKVPYWLAVTAGYVSEFISDFMTHRPPVAPLEGVRMSRAPMAFNTDRARDELGMPQTPLRETIRQALAWFETHGLFHPQKEAGAEGISAEPIAEPVDDLIDMDEPAKKESQDKESQDQQSKAG